MTRILQLLTISLFFSLPYCSAASCKAKHGGKVHSHSKGVAQSTAKATALPTTVSEVINTVAAPTTVVAQTTSTKKAGMTTVKTVAPTTKISTPASTPTSTSSSSSGPSGDSATYVSIHNTERAKYGASPLVWNNTLAAAAQKWANECKGAHSGGTLGPFGENLAWGTGDFTIADGLQAWMNEEPEYSPSNPVDSHWTQMVWKATTNLGCAVAVCDNLFNFATYGATQYYVCEYWPQGNVGGEYAQNVQN